MSASSKKVIIAALIGLDFFRRFKVTIDYGEGVLVCEPLKPKTKETALNSSVSA